jgi:hypothetical protein
LGFAVRLRERCAAVSCFVLASTIVDCSLDAALGSGGKVTTGFFGINDGGAALAIQADGKIVAAGFADSASTRAFALARYKNAPTLILPAGAFFPSTGGEAIVSVTAPLGSPWTASSNDSWINVTSSENGDGNGTVTYAVRDNLLLFPRQGTMNIAGSVFTVTQDGNTASDCLSKISPAFEAFNVTGGTGAITVTTGAQCAWQAVSNSDWIRITPTCCGIGSGTVTYTVAANSGGSGRRGMITAAGRSFSVKQKGS